jgi:hypothetical protein
VHYHHCLCLAPATITESLAFYSQGWHCTFRLWCHSRLRVNKQRCFHVRHPVARAYWDCCRWSCQVSHGITPPRQLGCHAASLPPSDPEAFAVQIVRSCDSRSALFNPSRMDLLFAKKGRAVDRSIYLVCPRCTVYLFSLLIRKESRRTPRKGVSGGGGRNLKAFVCPRCLNVGESVFWGLLGLFF